MSLPRHRQQLLKGQLLQRCLISTEVSPVDWTDFSWQLRFTPVGSLNKACMCTNDDFTDFTNNDLISYMYSCA